MQHTLPKSVGHHTCHRWWSFHLKCGEDHNGYRPIHDVPKGSLGSHLGLRDLVHIEHCVLDDRCFEFLGDVLPATALVGLGAPKDLRYAFPIT
jgi:hypothetical protein